MWGTFWKSEERSSGRQNKKIETRYVCRKEDEESDDEVGGARKEEEVVEGRKDVCRREKAPRVDPRTGIGWAKAR
jgi:hypothetical protein